MNIEPAVHVEGLCKAFGRQVALDDLDLDVPRGTVFGLLGRNGAGKTTLLRVIMGLLHPDRGTACVLGADMRTAPLELRARVAYVPQEVSLIARLDLASHADLLSHFYPRFDVEAARASAHRLDVDWDRALGTLSPGTKRKAAVALALCSGADVIVLDEPAAGLDPLARRALYELLIERLGDGGELTVLLSTHLVDDLERLADRVAIVDQGRTLQVDDVEGYASSLVRVQVVFPDDVPDGFVIPGAGTTSREGCVAVGIVDVARAGERLTRLEAESALRVRRFPLRLEEVFVQLVGRAPIDSETEDTP